MRSAYVLLTYIFIVREILTRCYFIGYKARATVAETLFKGRKSKTDVMSAIADEQFGANFVARQRHGQVHLVHWYHSSTGYISLEQD